MNPNKGEISKDYFRKNFHKKQVGEIFSAAFRHFVAI
jgi:hypothetical protein